jgi:hypothetical protein
MTRILTTKKKVNNFPIRFIITGQNNRELEVYFNKDNKKQTKLVLDFLMRYLNLEKDIEKEEKYEN